MKFNLLVLLLGSLLLWSCAEENQPEQEEVQTPEISFQNKGHELVYELSQRVGNYEKLRGLKDVVYTCTYLSPTGQSDVSTEKYIFDGELSYGIYERHDRTLAKLEGTIEQAYDGEEFWLKHEGELLEDSSALEGVAFKRPTNFYWFTMFQKLLDPGLKYDYLGEKQIEGQLYDVVAISFDFPSDKPTDIYQIYLNQKSGLVDQFLFTVVDYGVMEKPLLMQLEYEEVDGLWIPSKRRYKKSTWEAEINDQPWIEVTWSNIQFNAGLTQEDFKAI
ncbi:hypothetical protein KFE98_10425 [bacterium SCSIO 12741]|nr:hypothetical protein KFE98_10425 [bacterium SCSIO 12741]